MNSQSTRLRINLSSREIEWEGSEDFIDKYEQHILDFIESIKDKEGATLEKQPSFDMQISNVKLDNNTGNLLPSSFGEFYSKFPRNISVTDKILIAAYYFQETVPEKLFTPKDASDLLKEQSVPITNANAFVKSLLVANKIFKNSGKYKLSEKGVDNVMQLMSLG